MLAKIHSFILIGIDAQICEVEVDVSNRGLKTTIQPYQFDGEPYQVSPVLSQLDFANVRDQEDVERAITITAANTHNLLMLCEVKAAANLRVFCKDLR
jgi:predicted ATPase with chaperone activity